MSNTPSIKGLAGETVIYGLSSVLGRAVSFLLLPIYTAVLSTTDYGVQSLIYVYAAVIFVFYVLRFDTAYFRFASDDKFAEKSFHTAFSGVAVSSLILSFILFAGAQWLAEYLFNIPEKFTYIIQLLAGILFFDALAEIPYARLRLEKRAFRFASIRLINIGVNVGLNCIFLLLIPYLIKNDFTNWNFDWFPEEMGIGFIFISNLIASVTAFLLLFPQWKSITFTLDKKVIGRMWSYSAPLVIVALAGIINEMIDRAMLDRLLPYDDEMNKAEAGIYSAAYKFSILIALFTQAYRYAAEPFFFAHARDKKSPDIYARVSEFFVLVACLGFLAIMFFLPILKKLMRNTDYHEGVIVVPILIMANIFLGIYYNLSVWYKLTDKTKFAMYIAIGGAGLTILLNYLLIPHYGYIGSAWATLICYASMTFASFVIGKKHYPLKHRMPRLIGYMVSAALIYYLVEELVQRTMWSNTAVYIVYTLVLLALGLLVFRQMKRTDIGPKIS